MTYLVFLGHALAETAPIPGQGLTDTLSDDPLPTATERSDQSTFEEVLSRLVEIQEQAEAEAQAEALAQTATQEQEKASYQKPLTNHKIPVRVGVYRGMNASAVLTHWSQLTKHIPVLATQRPTIRLKQGALELIAPEVPLLQVSSLCATLAKKSLICRPEGIKLLEP
ncbi:hypothetical protein ACQU0X_26975 [Pseudovibrio ascidiaceicola]|uniref:hypothetical protein n=1 Tax=Pseudovibrio ascidiaceicola TaxID=285279 RepID=UPI003D35A442